MTKVYVAAQRVVSDNGYAYALAGEDVAFLSNIVLTTHKRQLQNELGLQLVNWSYECNVPPKVGEKVYVIVRKAVVNDKRVLLMAGADVAYESRVEATKALREMGGGTTGDNSLILYSFTVKADAEKTYRVSIEYTVKAGSVDKVIEEAENALGGHDNLVVEAEAE